jgi:hypothetical protein
MTEHPLRAAFDRCAPLIAESLKHEHHPETLDDVWAEIAAGRAQLWDGDGTVVITRLVNEDGRAVLFWIVAGPLRRLLWMTPGIEAFGRSFGATQAGFVPARKGWARVMESWGYHPLENGFVGKEL